jgi:hypothetical protein
MCGPGRRFLLPSRDKYRRRPGRNEVLLQNRKENSHDNEV